METKAALWKVTVPYDGFPVSLEFIAASEQEVREMFQARYPDVPICSVEYVAEFREAE